MRKEMKEKVFSVVPRKFVKHYVAPLLVSRQVAPYKAKEFFEDYHRTEVPKEFSDRMTIQPDFNPLFARYHYNAVENSILRYFCATAAPEQPRVLDIGSGSGHWIDFYRTVFAAQQLVGVEISQPCADALREKYRGVADINIVEADITDAHLQLGQKFDIINAIGVMFHIVDDNLWRQALRTLSTHLHENGTMVIGGQFGLITANVQFWHDDMSVSPFQLRGKKGRQVFVDKRIRSLRLWKSAAGAANLRVASVQRTTQDKRITTPENNVLILKRAG